MKLSIGQRILVGLGVVVVLGLGLALYMLHSLSQVHEIGSKIAERDIQILTSQADVIRSQGEMQTLRERFVSRTLLVKAKVPGLELGVEDQPAKIRETWQHHHQLTAGRLEQLKQEVLGFSQSATSADRQAQWKLIAHNLDETMAARLQLEATTHAFFDQLSADKLQGLEDEMKAMAEHRKEFESKLGDGIKLTRKQSEVGRDIAVNAYHQATLSAYLGLGSMLAMGLAASLLIQRSVTVPLGRFMNFVGKVGEGDLTQKAPPTQVVELTHLGVSLDAMVGGLRTLSDQIVAATHSLSTASQQILTSVQEQSAGTREQAAAVQQIATTIEEVNRSGNQIAEKAREVAATAESTSSSSAVGLQAVQNAARTVQAIREQVETFAKHIVVLSDKTQAIGEIILAVNDIAERSNLLALNAGIEAAGAGEHGSRFGVVAGEMKKLADQAKASTSQVQAILIDIQKGINNSVVLTREAVKRAEAGSHQAEVTEQVIRQMAETTTASIHAFQQIIAATRQQQIGFDQVTQGMKDIRQVADQTAVAISQLELAVGNVNGLTRQLNQAVGRYKL